MSPLFTWMSLLLLRFLSISMAVPWPLDTRNTNCLPASMIQDERVWDCPHKYYIDSKSGSCSPNIPKNPGKAGCTAYCEMSLSLGWGEEIPVPQGYCQEQTTCQWQESKTVTTTQTWEVNTNVGLSIRSDEGGPLKASFDIGASYSYSKALSYTTGSGSSKPLGAGQCGYWTFVPFTLTSCGTLSSEGQTTPPPPPSLSGGASIQSPPFCGGKGTKVVDTPNWCNTAPYSNSDGRADGAVIFVYLNCTTHKFLQDAEIPQTAPGNPGPQKQQPQAFYPGVFTGRGAPSQKI